jgi:hypothetical protein
MPGYLVYDADGGDRVFVGGLADRIYGMTALYQIALALDAKFFIKFESPFKFFDVFAAEKTSKFRWPGLESFPGLKVFDLNLVDENCSSDNLEKLKLLLENNTNVVLVKANQIPIDFIASIGDPNKWGKIERENFERLLILEFGSEFLEPNETKLSVEFKKTREEITSLSTLGIAIRVGGGGSGWIDSNFNVPHPIHVLSYIKNLECDFDMVFLASDSITYKEAMMRVLKDGGRWRLIKSTSKPLHLERSFEHSAENVYQSSVYDHLHLRSCAAGVVTGGGRYGRTAAYLANTPLYPLYDDTTSRPL